MGEKLKIVVADNNPAVRECLRLCLAAFGHEVRAVEGGQALLAACAVCPPDVVVSEVQMPDLDGVTAVEALRHHSDTPVVFLSGSWAPSVLARAGRLAAVWCLQKPISPQALARAVRIAAQAGSGRSAALLPDSRPPPLE